MRATATTLPRIEVAAAYEAIAALENAARNANKLLLLCAAPFVGLAFVVTFPIVGLALLAWMAARAFAARWKRLARAMRNVALFFAAPFIGLAYAVAIPFVGAGMLVYAAARAAKGRA